MSQDQTTRRKPVLVPDQTPLVRAALRLADFSMDLRAQGVRCENAEKALEETPPGMTRSGTIALLAHKRYEEMLAHFDVLAREYADAKVASIMARNKGVRNAG